MLVTIGVPLYNEETFLDLALDSLLAQTHGDLEVIISDNASTDRTEEICRARAAADPRIRYIRQPKNIGAIANFFSLLDQARGEYFMWGSGHDIWSPEFVEKCAAVLTRRPEVGLVYPRVRWIDRQGNQLGIDDYAEGIGTMNLGQIARFNSVLWRSIDNPSFYGLYRTDMLRRLKSRPHTHGWDKIVLAELSLYCAFVELADTLLFYRETRVETQEQRAARQFTYLNRSGNARHRPELEKAVSFMKMAARADVGVVRKLALFSSIALCLGTRRGATIARELLPFDRR